MTTQFENLKFALENIDEYAGESNILDRLDSKDELRRASEAWGKVRILSILA